MVGLSSEKKVTYAPSMESKCLPNRGTGHSRMFGPPTFKVTMGSWGPNISEPRQTYLISKSASPTIAGASFSFLALGHSFFQCPKPWHWAHWFGRNGAWGLLWDRGRTVLSLGQMRFSGGPEIDFPKQQLALQISCPLSFPQALWQSAVSA